MTSLTLSRTLFRIFIVLAVVAAAAAAIWFATRSKPVAVLVAAAEPGRVETTVANTRAGSVSACRRAKLAPPLGGRIEKLTVHKGDRVKKGQLLLELWNDDLLARERVSIQQMQTAGDRVLHRSGPRIGEIAGMPIHGRPRAHVRLHPVQAR